MVRGIDALNLKKEKANKKYLLKYNEIKGVSKKESEA